MPPKPIFDLSNKKIWVAGETGMVGRAVLRHLSSENVKILSASHKTLDLCNQKKTQDWLLDHKPDVVIMAAGKVGGIGANVSEPKAFYEQNIAMAQSVIHGAYEAGVTKLLYLGSSCIYPRDTTQPMKEEALFTGALEPTNEAYAKAKIEAIQLCQHYAQEYGCHYISAIPTNLYGAYDHFDVEKSHVIPAMILKIHQAKMMREPKVTLWGTGNPLREFLCVDDLADALIFLLKNYSSDSPINIGSGKEILIKELAKLIADVMGYEGDIEFDSSKPDGMPRKLLESSKINNLGWSSKTLLKQGLEEAYEWFVDNH